MSNTRIILMNFLNYDILKYVITHQLAEQES